MATLFTDDFNRADEVLTNGANWRDIAGASEPAISSNVLADNGLDYSRAAVDGVSFPNDQYAEMEVTRDKAPSLLLRVDPVSGYKYAFFASSTSCTLAKTGTGGYTSLVTSAGIASNTFTMRFEVVGTTLKGYVDGVEEISITDSELASGVPGLQFGLSSTATVDNFKAGDFTAAADTTAPTVTSASVPTAGDTIAVQMSESMQVGAGGSGGWTISLGDATISSAAVDGTDDTIINLTPSRTLLSGETFTIGYTQPGDGFQDQATTPNDLATLSGQAVTNNSTQTATLSISAADNITSEGDTVTFTLANNSGAPTGATLNGTDVGTLTLVSGSTYSYTGPLLPDDATADLVVSVDSTTVSTQISYANSYPYVLTNHGTPQPNSVMEGNQFGSTQPVELKVITDTNASIADIDWQAMSDNQQWLTDIRNASSVTSVADGSTSFTLGYFVQETGATGTFERTVTTTDTLSPAIDSVSVPTAGTYHAGDVLSFTVNWNENVTVTGTPALNLSIGGSARQANYASGSTTAALVFTYTVQAGDVDADGIAVVSLTLDGGTIKDGATNDAFLTLNSVGDTSGVLVDADGAVIQSVSVPTAGTYVPGNALDFTVTFEAAVTVTGSPELLIGVGGTQKSATYVSGSTTTALLFRYTVVSGDLDTDGVAVSSLSLAGGTIKDQYSVDANLALNGVADSSGVLVDGVGPAITVNPLTTLDTAPIVSGSAGDATSLTLVVTGVGTYTPTPSGGSWSQQLPTLALGDYAMTLNGEDAAGNAASEQTTTLRIVNEIPVMRGRPGFHMKMSMGF